MKTYERIMIRAPKVILFFGVALGSLLLWMTTPCYWGCGVWLATGVFFFFCLRKIPARPPYIGVVMVWAKKLPMIVGEGWHLLAPFFPFLYTVTTIKVEKTNIDITYLDIRCRARTENQTDAPRAGGEISINISYTYYPDYKCDERGTRLIAFIDSGGHDGVQKIIKDLIEEDIRQIAADKSWEEISFAGDEIRNALVKKITGEELGNAEELARLNKNGFPDIADLGIRICRFNIGKVKEQGELAKAAELFAKEVQERRGEEEELNFVYGWIKKFKQIGGIDGNIAANIIQTERGKVTRNIQEYRGLEGPAQLGTAVVAQFLSKGTTDLNTKRTDDAKDTKKDKKTK